MKQWGTDKKIKWPQGDLWKYLGLLGATLLLVSGGNYQYKRMSTQTLLIQEVQENQEITGVTFEPDDRTNLSMEAEFENIEVTVEESHEITEEMIEEELPEEVSEDVPEDVQIIPAPLPADLSLNAISAALLDAENQRVLYEKNGQEQRAMASTTKIMTCILALEYGNMEDVVTFSAKAAAQPDVQMNAAEGEQYYLKDLLYSLMLESHNDTAVAIAEHIGGSVEEFAELMNEKAQELGAYETHFVTPNGLDAEGHYTTACDLGKIACYAIRNQEFLDIIKTPAHSFQELNGRRSVVVTNKDAFLTSYDGAFGIKTGFTGEAGYCFVGAARRDGKTFVSVVLGSGWPPHKSYKWNDTRVMMDYGMEHFSTQTIFAPDYELPVVPVTEGIEKETVTLYTDTTVTLLLSEEETVQYVEQLPEQLTAPLQAGDIAGTVDIYVNDGLYESAVVYIGESVEQITYEYIFRQLFQKYFLCS